MKRKQTSIDAHNSIKPCKSYYHEKILESLALLKGGGTFAEIGDKIGIKHDKVWKRLSELESEGKIFNTGATRVLPSGRKGSVWQLTELKQTPESIINNAFNGEGVQQNLFP